MQPGPDYNPYAAPVDYGERDPGDYWGSSVGPLATLGQRLGGSMLDSLAGFLFLLPGAVVGASLGFDDELLTLCVLGGLLPYAAIQAWLISTSGQSLAKKVLKIRIVTLAGEPPGFMRGVLLRSWLVVALSFIPLVGSLVSIVDAVMIFRPDRRTMHDHIAGTTVIQVL